MQHAKILARLAGCLLLTACTGFSGAGLRPDPLPASVEDPCPHPGAIGTGDDWEIFAGRLGDALIECAAEKSVAVDAFNAVRRTIGQQ